MNHFKSRWNHRYIVIALLVVVPVLAAACGGARTAPLTGETLNNGEYHGVYQEPIQLTDGTLMDYENMGVLRRLKGLIVGRAMCYTEEEKQQLREVVLERTRRYTFPIVTDMDFGHTSPQFTIPIGCRARIDAENRRFEIIDAAVE